MKCILDTQSVNAYFGLICNELVYSVNLQKNSPLFKDTALGSTIADDDLTMRGQAINSDTMV